MDRGLDRRPGGKDSDLDDNEAKPYTELYVHACLAVIEFAKDPVELRDWFRVEREQRFDRYLLSKQQIDRIVLACRDQVWRLENRGRRVA